MLRWSFIGFYGAADEIGLPVPGVQIVERGRKIHEEKKKRGETPPPPFPPPPHFPLPHFPRLSERLEQAKIGLDTICTTAWT